MKRRGDEEEEVGVTSTLTNPRSSRQGPRRMMQPGYGTIRQVTIRTQYGAIPDTGGYTSDGALAVDLSRLA